MQVILKNQEFKATSQAVEVNDHVFNVPYNEALIHQVVTSTMTNSRSGTKAQKTRADVSGGGAKPWRQKGTGRARAGSTRSPLWRTGGKVFAAQPKNYDQKINKKMYKGALRSILSELNRTERLIVVDKLVLNQPKTKELVNLLKPFDNKKVVIITNELDTNLYLAGRNIYKLYMIDVEFVDPVSLVAADQVIITSDALKTLEEALA
jgi:large subunit ribosomal protein L4